MIYTDINDIKAFEKVSPLVTKKYVPIFTSEIIELLKPEFELVEVKRFGKATSAHYADFISKDGIQLRIYNSYDRELALRVNLLADGMLIPLGVERLVHMGQNAKNFTKEFKDAKKEIIDAVQTAKDIDTFLKGHIISEAMAKKFTEVIFKLPKNREAVSIKNPVESIVGKMDVTLKEFIKKSIVNYLRGEYQYTNKEGKTLKGPKQGTLLARVIVENRVIKEIDEQFPELFI